MRFAVLDMETTGLYPYAGDEPIEVASIVIDDETPGKIFHRFYLPKGRMEARAKAIHGMDRRIIRNMRRKQAVRYPEKWAEDCLSVVQ